MSFELLEQDLYLALIAPSKGMTFAQRINSLEKVAEKVSGMAEMLASLRQTLSEETI